MTIKWPALKAALEQHTIDWRGARLAGFLVRCTASRKELGYVWKTGVVWRWRTPDNHSGERTSQRAAVEVLRDAHDLRQQPSLLGRLEEARDYERAKRATDAAPTFVAPTLPPMKAAAPKPPPVAAAPPKGIVWNDQAGMSDLTTAVADALRRGGKP